MTTKLDFPGIRRVRGAEELVVPTAKAKRKRSTEPKKTTKKPKALQASPAPLLAHVNHASTPTPHDDGFGDQLLSDEHMNGLVSYFDTEDLDQH